VAVVRHGRLLLCRGYGLANVEWSVPAAADTIYPIASVTKTFTAAAIMLLVESGQLALDDRISDYLPDCPPTWREITVRHLLTHTSGIPDDLEDMPQTPPAEHLGKVASMPLDFAPGQDWRYSNTGYVLLARIIEQTSGQSFS
jgi:D-alanyl-D-alanine carboxypeptidase